MSGLLLQARSGRETLGVAMNGRLHQARSGKETLGPPMSGRPLQVRSGKEIRGMLNPLETGLEMNGTPPFRRKYFLHEKMFLVST